VLRFDDTEEVRRISAAVAAGSESTVLRRVMPCVGVAVRTEVDHCGSSVLEELALDVLMSASRAPCLERGGGGGAFGFDKGSLLFGAGLGREASVDCCEDMVRDELLRDRLLAPGVRS
jgi:hypothetical protein